MKEFHASAYFSVLLAVLVFIGFTQQSISDDAEIGKPAPVFTLPGTDGESYDLESLQGQFVVLEWLNFGCPYVERHYRTGNMPALQKEYTEKGVKWLSIVSSAPGTQGYYESDEMNAENEKMGGMQSAILLDPEGDVGKMYGAITTPHMYIIDKEGILIYKGGIDDQPRASYEKTKLADNYVRAALEEAMNGDEVSVPTSRPYGCSVKYKK
ncbi:MAG: thioredoxin family protein [Rhodothermaceae bacterium]|nr:thioredoxin family protein [Rhodothermaceae bacterium]MYD19455.1 thioredoxin family protein [Rhodothermaceae bacterium]MYD56389.1 thioredoxin family protein [Rhodothermaceae bacterium]MYI43355.1 thioredoxin family protein [Rhodothermaceae bacterium]MYJ56815.1 thioredoxin family protein [Rhodothermaceae bacterium]